jgi:hypothetical protein
MPTQTGLRVIQGGCEDRFALSLVSSRGRVDVPVRSLIKVEAHADDPFDFGDNQILERAYVAVWFAPAIREQIFELTSQIVGAPLSVVVDGETVTSAIVREPLGRYASINISIWSLAEAEAIAQKMRAGWRRPELRVVAGLEA